jgi:hypothetical protein
VKRRFPAHHNPSVLSALLQFPIFSAFFFLLSHFSTAPSGLFTAVLKAAAVPRKPKIGSP